MKLYDFEFEGKKYKQKRLSEVAKIIGTNYDKLSYRLENMSIQEAVYFKKKQQLYDFEFNKKQYHQKSLMETAKITGIPYKTLLYRLKKMTIQDAINKPVYHQKLYDFYFEGNKYKHKKLSEVVNITDIQYDALSYRLENMSIQEAIDLKQQMKLYDFEFGGKKYQQKKAKEVSEITGIKYGTVLSRLEKMMIQEVINKPIQNSSSKLYDFEFEGKTYEQKKAKEVAKIIGLSYQTLVSRLKKMPIQEAINTQIRDVSPKLYDFYFEGKEYKQKKIKEMAEITGMGTETLVSRMKKMPIQDAINKPVKNQNSSSKLYDFEFNGKKYKQKKAKEVAKIIGISYTTLVSRLEKMTIQEVIDKDFVISKDGQHYTFEQVSKEFGLNLKQVKKLKKIGFTYEDFKNM